MSPLHPVELLTRHSLAHAHVRQFQLLLLFHHHSLVFPDCGGLTPPALEGPIITKCLVTWIDSYRRMENGGVKSTGRTILEQQQHLIFMAEVSVCLEFSWPEDRALTKPRVQVTF